MILRFFIIGCARAYCIVFCMVYYALEARRGWAIKGKTMIRSDVAITACAGLCALGFIGLCVHWLVLAYADMASHVFFVR